MISRFTGSTSTPSRRGAFGALLVATTFAAGGAEALAGRVARLPGDGLHAAARAPRPLAHHPAPAAAPAPATARTISW